MPGNNFFLTRRGVQEEGQTCKQKKYGVEFYKNRHEMGRTKTIMDGKSNGCKRARGKEDCCSGRWVSFPESSYPLKGGHLPFFAIGVPVIQSGPPSHGEEPW
jgi:hypothetical protein